MDKETPELVTIRLEPEECRFLITVLRSTGSILNSLMALHNSMPGLSPPPVSAEAIVNIVALADKVEQQAQGFKLAPIRPYHPPEE